MKNNFLCILAIVLLGSSCGKDNVNLTTPQPSSQSNSQVQQNKIMQIPDDLKDDINLINQELTVYLKSSPIDNLIIEYSKDERSDYENEAKGVCIKSPSTPKIILYYYHWIYDPADGLPNMQMSRFQREVSLFHLIGHCVFNKPHSNEMNGAMPKSFMHSNFLQSYYSQGLQNNGLHLQLSDLKREFYNYQGQW